MKTILIGIDPGRSGGIAVDNGHGVVSDKMPATEGDIYEYLMECTPDDHPKFRTTVALEEVGGYTGGAGSPGSAMFNFGRNFGFLIGVCMTIGFRIEFVKPAKWMKDLGMGTRGKRTKTEWKNHLKGEAQRLYPDQKVTLATADALLILEWLRKQ